MQAQGRVRQTRHSSKLAHDPRAYRNTIEPFLARYDKIILFVRDLVDIEATDSIDVADVDPDGITCIRPTVIELDPESLSLPHGKEDASALCDPLWQLRGKSLDVVKREKPA
jgi:hypothetical protein